MQQKMADYQQPAPEVSWDLLDKTLASNKPKAKVVPMWTRRLAAAVVAAVIVVSAGYLMLRQQDEDTLAVVSQHTPEAAQTRELTQTEETIHTVAESNAQPQRLLAQAASQSTTTATTENVETTQEGSLPVQSVQQEEKERTANKPAEQKSAQGDSSSTKDRSVASQSPVHSATVIYPSDFHRSTSSTDGSRLMAKAYLSNSMAGNANAMSLSTAISNSENNCPDINDPKDNSNPTYNPSTPIVQEKEERVSHRQPIRFGLTLCYRLSDQWSIESGLSYTRLSSDYTYLLAGTPYAQGEQQLSYIGIPLKVNYQLWNSRHVGLYVTAGGMMEKMVKGSLQMTENGKEQKTDVSIKALQFSVNGAVGMEYRLTNLMSIYAEPGVGYYFDNSSDVPTYYQEKPFSFNLNVGLRFSIK